MQAAKSLSSLLQQRSLSVFLFVGDVFHLIGTGGGTTARCLVEVELLVWSYIHDVFWLRWDGLASRFHYILAWYLSATLLRWVVVNWRHRRYIIGLLQASTWCNSVLRFDRVSGDNFILILGQIVVNKFGFGLIHFLWFSGLWCGRLWGFTCRLDLSFFLDLILSFG